jgi:hypothetical protein
MACILPYSLWLYVGKRTVHVKKQKGLPIKRAIEHGATKRELFEAGQAAGVPGGGITVGLWMQILTQLDREGAFKNG